MNKIIPLLILVVFIFGCTQSAKPAVSNVQIANPASVFCEEHGGKLDIKDEVGGQVGYCTLPDGKVCEEWAFYRGECPK
jgi:putative hemolysin